MPAHFTKSEASYLLPATPVADQVEAIRLAASRARDAAAMHGVARFVDRVLGWPARIRARAELAALSERELSDIGLTRGDIDRVADGAFDGR
ncbi:hypothetical protein GCM10011504_42830 [Siccirubricoccus deserti]|nr:DUF1127 domain-containing protein [Siccirubricoccus deserti]GGC60028.1 hypothetical protein GCM10011504_42830 [Siccirubricoccus deserti]